MGKLRHIAIAVATTDETAKFYEQAFGMTRVRQSVSSIMLTDGVISLAILDKVFSSRTFPTTKKLIHHPSFGGLKFI